MSIIHVVYQCLFMYLCLISLGTSSVLFVSYHFSMFHVGPAHAIFNICSVVYFYSLHLCLSLFSMLLLSRRVSSFTLRNTLDFYRNLKIHRKLSTLFLPLSGFFSPSLGTIFFSFYPFPAEFSAQGLASPLQNVYSPFTVLCFYFLSFFQRR